VSKRSQSVGRQAGGIRDMADPAISWHVAAAVAWLAFLALPAHAQISSCEQAGTEAERQHSVPSGLLPAIGRVESGRWDATYRRTVPWPWAINADGAPWLAANKEEAVSRTRALQAGGVRNIDVGCFQINLQHHPSAFANLEQAFDPVANAQYAARFLASLRTRLGGWEQAVAAYHSSSPERGIPYRQAVLATWSAPGSIASPGRNIEPVVVYSIGGTRISVWSPSSIGAAGTLIAMPRDKTSNRLPRVIAPGR
jgi:soluble lytic murein transglycosylase-like protein